jgi:hypothetical protein
MFAEIILLAMGIMVVAAEDCGYSGAWCSVYLECRSASDALKNCGGHVYGGFSLLPCWCKACDRPAAKGSDFS